MFILYQFLGFNGPNSIMPGQIQGRRAGPGEGPAYGRAKQQAERDRIRQNQMNGSMSFADPMAHLRNDVGASRGRINGDYSPSFNDESNKRGKSHS